VLDEYRSYVQGFTQRLLDPYITRIEAGPTVGPKEFNDPVWGTIALNGAEVLVLDSPLVQRLRRIRQLGVVHLVFPGANHTRLEHSIGTCHQVQRMADAITQHSTDPGVRSLFGRDGDAGWLQVLRLAALCHDIGHGFMSHVSENALALTGEYKDLVFEFRQEMSGHKQVDAQLSEIAAYFMLKTESFNRLVGIALQQSGQKPINNVGARIANCVIGISDDPTVPLIHEFISGPFDCDKLDYMTRDAMMCGVPVVTDVMRLVQKVRAVPQTTAALPDELKQKVPSQPRTHTIVGIQHSGASTLDEVALGRSLLHHKVYRHQKVRASEVMVASIIHELLPLLPSAERLTLPLRLFDDDVLALSGEDVKQSLGKLDLEVPPVVLEVSQRLRGRDLFVRAFAFGKRMPDIPYTDDPDQKASLSQLMEDSRDSKKRLDLVDRIAEEAVAMAAATGRDSEIAALPGGRLQPYVWLSAPPDRDSSSTDVLPGWLIRPDGSLRRLEEESPAIRGVSDAYLNSKETGYVFCPREFAALVYLATELAIYDVYHSLVIPKSMGLLAHVDMDQVKRLRLVLAQKGYYESRPRLFWPEPKLTTSAWFPERCEKAARHLATYQGPFAPDTEEQSGCVTAAGVEEWVCQFPENLIDCALKVVESVQVVNRALTYRVLDRFLKSENGSGFVEAALVPLGSPKDSSSVLAYLGQDLSNTYRLQAMTLEAALVRTDLPIILLDDIIQKGTTVEEIIAEAVDEPADLTQGVARYGQLSKRAIRQLKARSLALVVVAAAPEGVQGVRNSFVRHDLKADVHCYYDDFEAVPSVGLALAGNSQQAEFIEYCQEVGKQLVAGERNEEQRILGYGNWGLLLTGMFNPPTAALTALWHEGEVNGIPWRPLLRRKKKT